MTAGPLDLTAPDDDPDAASLAALARVTIRYGLSIGDELAEIFASVPRIDPTPNAGGATVYCESYREHQLSHVHAPPGWPDEFACPTCGRRPVVPSSAR